MDAKITDMEALTKVSPVMLRAYLEAQGWRHEQTWRDRILVWSNNSSQATEVLMTLREQSDTYGLRIAEAVETLALTEERSQIDVYHDLMGAGADIIRLTPMNGTGQPGRTLSESADFLNRARDLLTAAARAAERPGQPVHRGRISGEVTEYMRGVRPLPGYQAGPELTLHAQVPAGYGVQTNMGDPIREPFERRATISLKDGLKEAATTAEAVLAGRKIEDALNETSHQVTSANLYDAVAALAQNGHGIKLNLAWAVVRPSDNPNCEFAFSESTAEVFVEGAEILRKNSPFLDAHVTGEIIRLDRPSKEEYDGHALVLYQLDGRPIPLQVQFRTEDQDEVIRAFLNSIEISIDGDIRREGRTHTLQNPRNFTVIGTTT